MRMSFSIAGGLSAELEAYAKRIELDLVTRNRTAPFADLDAVSDHLHRERNPRLKITTNEAGTRTELQFRGTLILTIHG